MAFTKMLWKIGSGGGIPDSWDFWTSVVGEFLNDYGWDWNDVLEDYVWRRTGTCRKDNNLIAYYGIAVTENQSYPQSPYGDVVLMSPFPDAVTYTSYIIYYDDWTSDEPHYWRPTVHRYNSTIVDANGITWYVNYGGVRYGFDLEGYDEDHPYRYPFDKDFLLNEISNPLPDTAQGHSQAIQLMLDKIYGEPFVENYQLNQSYSFYSKDIRKAIRKSYGFSLFMNYVLANVSGGYWNNYLRLVYLYLSDNADSIIDTLINAIGDDNYIYIFIRQANSSNSEIIRVWHGSRNEPISGRPYRKNSNLNFTFVECNDIFWSSNQILLSIYYNDSSQTISPVYSTPYGSRNATIGIEAHSETTGLQTTYYAASSNIGVDY